MSHPKSTRRDFLGRTWRLTLGANLGLVGLSQADCSRETAPQPTAMPNVLIIYVDQMRADCLSALGHPELNTPNLDRCGFEEFVGFNHGHDYFHSIHYRDTDQPLHEAGFQPDVQTDLALEYLDRMHERSFLLMLSIGTPHWPCLTPTRYGSLFDPASLKLMPGAEEGIIRNQGPCERLPTILEACGELACF